MEEVYQFLKQCGTYYLATAAQEHMLEAYPGLRDRYAPGDGNTQIFALTGCTATFSSFTQPTRTLTF